MPIYSYSRLSTFENCPFQYKLQYIDRLKVEEESIEAFLGSRAHDTLEKLYRDLIQSKDNTVADLLAHYNETWDEKWHENVKIVKTEYTADSYRQTGEKCIRDYYARHQPFDESRTLDTEKKFIFDLDGHKIIGFIDRIGHKKVGHYEIHDYKTGKYLPHQKKFDEDRQLALYQIGVEKLWGDAEKIDLIWHYLAHDKEFRSNRTPEQLESLKENVISLIHKIERDVAEDNFPTNESGLCNWCSYSVHCPAQNHNIKKSVMTLDDFLK